MNGLPLFPFMLSNSSDFLLQGEGYEEARSLYNTILDSSDPTVQNLELSKRLEAVGPVMSALGNAAAKLLE